MSYKLKEEYSGRDTFFLRVDGRKVAKETLNREGKKFCNMGLYTYYNLTKKEKEDVQKELAKDFEAKKKQQNAVSESKKPEQSAADVVLKTWGDIPGLSKEELKDNYTVEMLEMICKLTGLTGYSSKNEPELVDMIHDHHHKEED